MFKPHILFCMASLVLAAASNAAPWQRRVDATPPMLFQAGGMSLDQAVAMVQAKYGARAVRTSSVEQNGRVIHQIRLRSADGSRVWTVQVDAASGREM